MKTQINSLTRDGIGVSGLAKLSRGFTLIELMIVVLIVGILLAIATPSFSVLSLRTKLKAYSNDFVASVYLARGEAIKRNEPVTLCIANAGGTACAGAGDWDQGWIVIEPGGDVLKWQEPLASGIKVFESSSEHTMIFQPSGIVSTPVTLTVCQNFPEEGIEERELIITLTGQHRVSTTTAGCP